VLWQIIRDRRVAFVASLVLMGIIWQILATAGGLEEVISTPAAIGALGYELVQNGELYSNVSVTLGRTLLGMVLTTILGTGMGILAGRTDFWRGVFQDYIVAGLAMPSLLAAIFAAIWFGGTSDLAPAAAASLLSFPFLAQNVWKGVENIDQDLLKMSKSFDVSATRTTRRVVIWSVLPQWFSGMRNAFSIAWKIVALTEFVGGAEGVGFKIGEALGLFSMTGVLTWTLAFSAVVIVVEYGAFRVVERRLFKWRRKSSLGL
jgi:ABC-type nitrate/sulfonate/bicarbonate transport system permease component